MADSGSSMAVLQSINLGDLLKEREGESSRPERQTLGSVLKIDDPRRPSQSLLDILNSEDQSNTHINSRVSRRSSLINRLKLRRAAISSWRTAAAQLALTRQGRSPGRTSPVSGIVRGRVVAAELLEATLTPMPLPSRPSMNLASALAAERLRTPADGSSLDDVAPSSTSIVPSSGSSTPLRVSLMALLEEADRHSRDSVAAAERNFRGSLLKDWDKASNEKEVESTEGAKVEYVCCVCMVRHKGAAFIPCGHTFCRVCSRELWVNRGSCPLCNGFILEILDIF